MRPIQYHKVMKLARINTVLLVLIIAINSYIIAAPLLPRLGYWWQKRLPHGATARLHRQLTTSVRSIPKDNRLVVPSMQLDQPIIEGTTMAALNRGPWRRPHSSTPDSEGNTVIVGHRFTYLNPRGTFYFLDKVRLGDEMGVYWHGKEYVYRVKNIEVVSPADVSVEAATTQPQLTLYSCTPLWWPKNRLVVIGVLEHVYE